MVGSKTLKKTKLSYMLLRLNWVQVIGTTLLSYVWLSTAILVSATANEIVSNNQKSELITNQAASEDSLPDLKQVLAEKVKLGKKAASIVAQKQPQLIAQTNSPGTSDNSPIDVDNLRQQLLIEPLVKPAPPAQAAKRTYPPGLSFGAPSAFGAGWGDAFVGASGATRSSKTGNNPLDGSTSAGFGLGNSQKLVGLEFAYNNGSIKKFGKNGTFDLKVHRIAYAKGTNQVGVAAGWKTFAQYGNEGVRDSSAYGVVTTYSLLRPNNSENTMPISFSAGAGGGDFRQGNASTGVFAGVGVQVHPQIGVGFGWSGVGLNIGASYVPVPTIPLTITAQGADLTDNSSGGTVFVLSVGYGFNFLPK
jgi:hypothetical protein